MKGDDTFDLDINQIKDQQFCKVRDKIQLIGHTIAGAKMSGFASSTKLKLPSEVFPATCFYAEIGTTVGKRDETEGVVLYHKEKQVTK